MYPKSNEHITNSLKSMDKLLTKDASKGKTQDIEAKEARDGITILDYDTEDIKGFFRCRHGHRGDHFHSGAFMMSP